MRRRPGSIIRRRPGSIIRRTVAFLVFGLLAVGMVWQPADPLALSMAERLQPPSPAHWFGTDAVGRDMFSRVLAGCRVDAIVAVVAVSLSAFLGGSLGVMAATLCGWAESALQRVVDGVMSFPLLVLAMALVAVLGPGLLSVMIATVVINMPFYSRLAAAQIHTLRFAPFITAARLGGVSEGRLMLTVLLPNALPTLAVQASLNAGWVMLNTAGLSYLGVGIRPPMPELGAEVAAGAAFWQSGQWWLVMAPGAVLVLVVVGLTVLGDSSRDWLDPRRAGQARHARRQGVS